MTRAAIVAALLACQAADARAQSAGRILVMPFENVTRERQIFWLGEASAVLLADELNSRGADAIAREERREAFDRLQVPPTASLTDATVIRIGQLVGASQVVVGTLRLDGEALSVRARNISIDAGRVQRDIVEHGAISDLFQTFERVAAALVPQGPRRGSTPVEGVRPSVAAFENYIKGLLAEVPTTAVNYLNAALKVDPQFARPRLALWRVYTDQGDHDRALAAIRRVTQESAYYGRARFMAGFSQLHLGRNDDAFATYAVLAKEREDAAVLNNLAIAQFRRGETSAAQELFEKAAAVDATDPDYFFNLGYTSWLARDVPAAIQWLREAVRREPADGDAHFVLGAALSAAGNSAEANREKELARRLSSVYLEWEKRPPADIVPRGLARIKEDVQLPHAVRIEETLTGPGQRDQRELARFYFDRGRRLFEQERDRDALAELSRTLFLSPYEAEAHLLIGRIHLRGGRITEAIDALKISLWSAESAEAHAVLAAAYLESKDAVSARAEAERALALDAGSKEAMRVLEETRP
jgi:tetratricopeptide (TPR) repeat protein